MNIDTLVVAVYKKKLLAICNVCASTILMDPAVVAEGCREQLLHCSADAETHNDIPAVIPRAALYPVQMVIVAANKVNSWGCFCHQFGADVGRPGAG